MRCISCITPEREGASRFCQDNECLVTDLVQEAVWHYWHPDELILCITNPESAHLAAECESRGLSVRILWLPEGTGEDAFWETFALLAGVAEEGEEILFEITGGRHSLPFIISLVATWMKEIKKVRVAGVLYATQPDEFGFRHFINLQPVLGVIDWIAGVRALTSHTDATQMTGLLTGLQGEIYRTREEAEPPTHLIGWSHLLGTFTRAVRLSRPVDALYAAWGISRDLPAVREEVKRFAPALLPVMEDMRNIGEMAATPKPDGLSPSYLMMQHRLIKYQIEKGLEIQAVSLSREWLISAMMLLLGVDVLWLDADARHVVSRTLTGMALTLQGTPSETTPYTQLLLTEENWKEMIQIWERVSDLRNELAHCGMNHREESLRSLLQRTSELPEELLMFARYAGIRT